MDEQERGPGMRVLVLTGSRHGATSEIGQVVADELRAAGHDATWVDAEALPVPDADGFDAYVLGSAVYVGHWTRSARRFVDEHEAALRRRPVWLFSSGPLGDPPKPEDEIADARELTERLGARDHQTFAGALARDDLSRVERLTVKAVHAPYGDFRDWVRVRAWARDIAADLTSADVH